MNLADVPPALLGRGLALLSCSLAVRVVATYAAVGGAGLAPAERLFTAVAWLPKATVQAAIGAVALDESEAGSEDEARGRTVLAIAVLAIICTAPLGAVAIAVAGPRLLKRDGAEATVATEAEAERSADEDEDEDEVDTARDFQSTAQPLGGSVAEC